MRKNRSNPEYLQKKFSALLEASHAMRILDLGWNGTAFIDRHLSVEMAVTFVGDDIRTVRVAQDRGLHALHCASVPALPNKFDVVFYHPEGHSAKKQVFHWIDGVFQCLKVGGRLFFAGQKDRGVLSYMKYVGSVFGNATLVGRENRMQFYCAEKTSDVTSVDPIPVGHTFEIDILPDEKLSFYTEDGVFAREGLDAGTERLLGEIGDIEADNVLDMGCGCGVIGIVCAKRKPNASVVMTDVSARAIHCATINIGKNQVENAKACVGDLYEHCKNQQFDLIVSNPPFHEGNQTGWPLVDGAYEHLVTGGRLVIVVMRPIPYQNRMNQVFGTCNVLSESGGYTVLCAQKI